MRATLELPRLSLAEQFASVDELLYNEKRNEVVFVKYLDDDTPPQ